MGRAADDWARWQERQTRPLYEATLSALEPLEGRALLDAGCGSGLALRLAARRGARTTGVDVSKGLLDAARENAPGTDLREGDLESLPFDSNWFDRVTAFNSLQYAQDPAAAARELARVTLPGGLVAVGVWGDPAECETDALFQAVRALAPPPPGAPAPLAVSAPGQLEGFLTAAGLEPVADGEVVVRFVYPSLADAWTGHSSAGPFQRAIDVAGADAVRDALNAVLGPKVQQDGSVTDTNIMRFVAARA